MPAAAPSRRQSRLLALRAIMDGRGVPVVVLRDARAVSYYADVSAGAGAVLVVTATESVLLAFPAGEDGKAPSAAAGHQLWKKLSALIGARRPVGHDAEPLPLADLPQVALGELIARQMMQ